MQFVFMFDHFKMGEEQQMCIWHILNSNLEFEFANLLQYTSIKWNFPHINTIYIMLQQLIMCLSIVLLMLFPLVDDCFGKSVSETEVIPEAEDR